MAIGTFSTFYYGTKITTTNFRINFRENVDELTAEVEQGTYSLIEFLGAIKNAMEAASQLPQEYVISVNRSTRQITITAAAPFELLLSSGSQVGTSPFALMGFTQGVDLTGATSYAGASGAGSEYTTQFPLQDYVLGDHNQERIDPSVNESASGRIEVVSFGIRKIFEMSFKYITDFVQDGKVIRNNPTGIADAVDFFENITDKGPFEFMPDSANRSTFFKVLLESTSGSKNGTGFKLKELTGQNLPGYFETNRVKLRVVE